MSDVLIIGGGMDGECFRIRILLPTSKPFPSFYVVYIGLRTVNSQ